MWKQRLLFYYKHTNIEHQLKWNPNFSNVQGKPKLVRELGGKIIMFQGGRFFCSSYRLIQGIENTRNRDSLLSSFLCKPQVNSFTTPQFKTTNNELTFVSFTTYFKPNRFKCFKVVANEDTMLRTQMFPRLPVRAIFVADTKFVSETQKSF